MGAHTHVQFCFRHFLEICFCFSFRICNFRFLPAGLFRYLYRTFFCVLLFERKQVVEGSKVQRLKRRSEIKMPKTESRCCKSCRENCFAIGNPKIGFPLVLVKLVILLCTLAKSILDFTPLKKEIRKPFFSLHTHEYQES